MKMSMRTMMEAMKCLVASYYLFNIDYPPKLKRTLLFYQLEVQKVEGFYARLHNRLQTVVWKPIRWVPLEEMIRRMAPLKCV